jgi:hypothetical protein
MEEKKLLITSFLKIISHYPAAVSRGGGGSNTPPQHYHLFFRKLNCGQIVTDDIYILLSSILSGFSQTNLHALAVSGSCTLSHLLLVQLSVGNKRDLVWKNKSKRRYNLDYDRHFLLYKLFFL